MDTIRMDTNPLSAGGTDAAADTVDEQDRMLPMGRRKGNPFPERVFRPAGGREMGLKCLLTHRCSLRDKRIYRAANGRGVLQKIARLGSRFCGQQRQQQRLLKVLYALLLVPGSAAVHRGQRWGWMAAFCSSSSSGSSRSIFWFPCLLVRTWYCIDDTFFQAGHVVGILILVHR